MFKRIVCATDGSSSAERALDYAKALATEQGAELVVVHVDEVMAGPRATGLSVNADEPDIVQKIKKQVADLEASGLKASLVLGTRIAGGAAQAISDAADAADADLIVVGTRGHTPIAGLLLGSVTQRLLHITHRPVLVIPAK